MYVSVLPSRLRSALLVAVLEGERVLFDKTPTLHTRVVLNTSNIIITHSLYCKYRTDTHEAAEAGARGMDEKPGSAAADARSTSSTGSSAASGVSPCAPTAKRAMIRGIQLPL